MSEIKLNKATFKGKTRYFESTSKSMKESSDMWQYELNGDELVTLKDGREGTLGGLIYDEDNTFIGYEFSENPYGDYNYEEIKPEDIEKVSDIYDDEDLMEALNEISREKANRVVKRRADQQYDAIQNYDINKPDTVDALHKAEDKLDRALNLRRNSAKLRKDESKMNEAIDNTIRIFLTNLGKYNEGDLVGEWVELPVDDWQPIFDRIGINDEYEEWFITDYEAPFRINEYDSIEELNDIAEKMQDFTDIQVEVLETYIDDAGYEMRDAIEKVADNEYLYIEGQTEEDLAYNYIDMIGSLDDAVSKEDQERYFDYEAFGRDLVLGGDYSYVDDVVDLNEFPDKDTAEMVFGDYGEDRPSEEDLNKYRQWIEIYGNYDESQEEQLAEQGIEVFMSQIYIDNVGYDVETLEQVVNGDYETQTGYQDNEGYVVEVYSERELAEYIVDDMYGSVSELGENTLQTYFDYEAFGRDLSYDFYKTENGWVDIN